MYESLPGFYVTALLFIPIIFTNQPQLYFFVRATARAYRKESYQLPLLNLVKGIYRLAIDPLGQGEASIFQPETGASDRFKLEPPTLRYK